MQTTSRVGKASKIKRREKATDDDGEPKWPWKAFFQFDPIQSDWFFSLFFLPFFEILHR